MENKEKYYCNMCEYKTNIKSAYDKHTKSAKHLRGGTSVSYKCLSCDYIATTRWNLYMHNASLHMTKEQKKNMQYYCEICDCLCFSKLYFKNHTESSLHKNNIILANEGGNPKKITLYKHNNESKIISEIKIYINNIKNEIIDAIKNK
jgi:hypothetical protein